MLRTTGMWFLYFWLKTVLFSQLLYPLRSAVMVETMCVIQYNIARRRHRWFRISFMKLLGWVQLVLPAAGIVRGCCYIIIKDRIWRQKTFFFIIIIEKPVLKPRRGVDQATYFPTLARLSAEGKPVRLKLILQNIICVLSASALNRHKVRNVRTF